MSLPFLKSSIYNTVYRPKDNIYIFFLLLLPVLTRPMLCRFYLNVYHLVSELDRFVQPIKGSYASQKVKGHVASQ